MGELDGKPFHAAAKRKFNPKEAAEKAVEICSLWEDYLRDPNWHPYKIIQKGHTAEVCTLFNYYYIYSLFLFFEISTHSIFICLGNN